MRQVNRDELLWKLRYRLGRMSAGVRRDFASREQRARDRAEYMIATELADHGLYALEILSEAPLAPDSDLFSAAAHGRGTGQAAMIDAGGDGADHKSS